MFHFTMRLTDNIKRGGVDDTLSGILPENRRLALESVGFVGHVWRTSQCQVEGKELSCY